MLGVWGLYKGLKKGTPTVGVNNGDVNVQGSGFRGGCQFASLALFGLCFVRMPMSRIYHRITSTYLHSYANLTPNKHCAEALTPKSQSNGWLLCF